MQGAKPSRPPQRAHQVVASGGGRRARAKSVPCLRALAARSAKHEGTPIQRSAACLRGGRAIAEVGPYPVPALLRRSAPVDAVRHATHRVSHLRKSIPYAQR